MEYMCGVYVEYILEFYSICGVHCSLECECGFILERSTVHVECCVR